MCDTFAALGNATATGAVILAKSADTEINEAQHLLKLPRRSYPEGALVRLTHLVIPQATQTHEVILDKSFWLYGGEIGLNEHGLAVGNEAVFSNQTSPRDGVVLIDFLRLILERCATCDEAIDLVADMLATYGQGGNCELRGNSHFDGSFLVADRTRAVVIETAGNHWAAREISDVGSISNGYTIGNDWLRSSLAGDDAGADFRSRFEDPELTRCVAARERQSTSQSYLEARRGKITVRTMADLLRYTGTEPYAPETDEYPTRICMHAAPHENRLWQATGALISDTRPDGNAMAWVTGTSGNDVSLFKPAFFGVDLPDLGPMPRESYTPGAYWWRHEFLHRRAMADYANVVPEIRSAFEALEDRFIADSETVRYGSAKEKQAFVEDCWAQGDAARDGWIAKLEKRNYTIESPAYRGMWDKFNKAASFPLS